MVFGSKFYIYGGGKWREVDLSDGRVEGWGRAKFVYPRRGNLPTPGLRQMNLHLAKTRAVLAALRDFNAGNNCAIKDGAHLPYKKIETIEKHGRNFESSCEHSRCCHHLNSYNDRIEITKKIERDFQSSCEHLHCCHHLNSNKNRCVSSKIERTTKINSGIQCTPKADAGIQTSLPSQVLSFPEPINKQKSRKRRRETTSSEENEPTEVTTAAMVHSKSKQKHPRLVLPKRGSTTDVSKEDVSAQSNKIPILKLNKADADKYNIYQRKRSDSTDSIVWVVLPKDEDSNENVDLKMKHQITEHLNRNSNKAENQNDNNSFRSKPKHSRNHMKSSRAQMKKKYRSHSEVQKAKKGTQSSFNASSSPLTKSNIDTREDQCKELIIDEKDVEILRNYLITHATDFDLYQFDQDDDYKKQFFFKINPLVNIERCPKIARMLLSENQNNVSLIEFASHLGLKSISEVSSPKRYRMRKIKDKRTYLDRDLSKSEMNKENSEKLLRGKHRKSNDELEKHNNIKSKTYSSYSSESGTSTDILEEYDIIERRKSERLNKTLKESNKTAPSTRYVTRKSHNSQKRYNEIQKSDDESNHSEVSGSSKKVYRKGDVKVGKNKLFTLYLTDDSEDLEGFEPPKRTNNEDENVKNNINSTKANDKNEDKELKISKESKKAKDNKRNNSKTNISITNKQKADVDDTKSSKYHNSRSKTDIQKVENHKNIRNNPKDAMEYSSDEEFTKSKDSIRRVPDKTNNIALDTSIRKHNDLTNSVKDSSDEEIPETLNVSNRKNRGHKTNIDHKALNGKSVDKHTKTSKASENKVQNKGNNENKQITKRNADDEKLADKTQKSSKDLSRNGLTKINDKDSKSNKLEKDVSKLKETNKRIENKSNNDNSKRIKTDHNEENSDAPRLRRHLKDHSTNTIKNTTSDTIELSDSEKELFVKKNGGFVKAAVKDVKSIMFGSKRKISRQPSSGLREYSNLEDHAILTWISAGGRASCVNGNRIWRDLQDQYERIAGQTRSWHSLRNRYLRYILPKLGQYALPQSQEARLRAAAATGEIKSRKREPRRNSIFALPTRGALSRRPGASRSLSSEPEPPAKRHKHDHTRRESKKSPSPKRVLRSSLHRPSPEKSLHSPRYSDITRRFAEKNRRDNSTPSTSPQSARELKKSKQSPKKNSGTESRRESSDSSSESEDSSRGLSQVKMTKKEKLKKQVKSRTRRLFNPNAM